MSQLWSNTGQGYMASDILSEDWRTSLQPITRFRQFCDVEEAIGKEVGEKFVWTIFGDTTDSGSRELQESQPMPSTSFPLYQGEVIVTEYGISIPTTLKYETMSQYNVPEVITKTLKNDANRAFDRLAHAQFDATILQAVAAGDLLPGEAATLAGIVEGRRKALETQELEQRIAILESTK